MALPHIFANGQNPNGTKFHANFSYLDGLISGGQGIKTDSTISQLHAAAEAAPTVPFICIPTDLPALMLYTGSATAGPEGNGFVTLTSWEVIS